MKSKLFILFLAVTASIGTMFASTKIGDLYYYLNGTNQTAEVARNSSASGEIIIPASVTYNEVVYSVTSIGNWAFGSCRSLTSITIPNSVTSIGRSAFENCSGLTSVTIPNSVTSIGEDAFRNCTGLTSVTIPNSVTSIGESAFWDCSSLTSIEIPNSVTRIGDNAFTSCRSLNSIIVENGNTTYDSRENCNAIIKTASNTLIAGCKNTIIPNSVTSIGSGAFSSCTGLTSVTIPNSVTSIGECAFAVCTGLTSVTIPNSVTSIGSGAFSSCTGLTSITIPNSVSSIGDYAFNNCSSLISVTIGNSVTSIGSYAFAYCRDLNTIKTMSFIPPTLGENVFLQVDPNLQFYLPQGSETLYQQDKQWGQFTSIIPFRSSYKINELYYTLNAGNSKAEVTYENLSNTNYTSLNKAVIPQSVSYKELSFDVTSISDSAFTNCASLNTIFIPAGIKSIGKDAFLGAGLTSVEWNIKSYPDFSSIEATPFYSSVINIKSFTFGNEVENIPAYLCNGMVGLEAISFPSSLTSIGDYAFANINSRKFNSIIFPHSVVSVGKGAFSNDIYLENIEFGDDMEFIGEDAFKGCSRVLTMTSWSVFTPNVATGALDDIKSATELYVRSSCLRKYEIDDNWNRFLLKEIGATETTMDVNEVTVVPADNTALFAWPTNENAATYTITITKGGEVFCILVFNANGQLTGIAFAPGRNGARQAHAAIVSNGGMQFTVTGLDIATRYDFTLKTQDETANVLAEYTGSFGTTGAVEGLYDLQSDQVPCTKVLRDGQIFILRGEKVYNAQGALVK